MEDDVKLQNDLDLTPVDQELDLELLQKNDQEQGEEDVLQFTLNSRRDERHIALYLLYALDRAEYSIDPMDAVRAFENGFELTIPRNSFAINMLKGVVEKRQEFDEFLTPFLKNWSLERLGCCTKLILHMALWEFAQDGVITSIVINEAVELAKMFAEKDAYRFVNGILDEIAKQRSASEQQQGEQQQEEMPEEKV